jgi:hypothetical protein
VRGGMHNPPGAGRVTWIVGAFALTALTPIIAAVATNTAVSAIILSMVSPCGFVVAVSKPTRRFRNAGRTRGEQPAHHAGKT